MKQGQLPLNLSFVHVKKIIHALLVILVFSYCRNTTTSTQEKTTPTASSKSGNELAQIYCGGCHLYPEPTLLDKDTWTKELLPNMGARLGIKTPNYDPFSKISDFDAMMIETENIYPTSPLIHPEDWNKIIAFYKNEAPQYLPVFKHPKVTVGLKNFDVKNLKSPNFPPLVTLTKIDESSKQLFIGTLKGALSTFSTRQKDIIPNDTFNIGSPPVALLKSKNETLLVLGIGTIHPNEQQEGSVFQIDLKSKQARKIMGNLKRPATFAALNTEKDIVIGEYGYQKGQLSYYKNGKKLDKILSYDGGATKVLTHDFNKDNLDDIAVLMAQGDERITIYYADKSGEFTEKRVLRFPPVYGSSDMQLVDFNKDGYVDILYTNGDNEDFSPILKPYHGVRVFLNDGKDNFTEGVFYPMDGAFQARAADFDLDGDMDIVVTSFFPYDKTKPDAHFRYLEQTKPFQFTAYTFREAVQGKWMTLDVGDADGDGDADILIGSFVISLSGVNRRADKIEKILPFIFLENKIK